ncbi:hypothetical protein SAMN06298226_0673 [Nitrosovibrio sp. Nv4]|nr:hypothetical protein SAMN06298226_0673 [Nitrosovibrio sp. Nv4]
MIGSDNRDITRRMIVPRAIDSFLAYSVPCQRYFLIFFITQAHLPRVLPVILSFPRKRESIALAGTDRHPAVGRIRATGNPWIPAFAHCCPE